MKDLFNSEQLEALRHHFPNISKAMEEGKTYSSKSPEAEVSVWVCNPPPPKGERPNSSLSQWSVTSFGFGRNFAGFGKRLCAYSKKVYGVALVGTGGPAPCRWALPDR